MAKRQANKKNYMKLKYTKKKKDNVTKRPKKSVLNIYDNFLPTKNILISYLKMCIDRSENVSSSLVKELNDLQSKRHLMEKLTPDACGLINIKTDCSEMESNNREECSSSSEIIGIDMTNLMLEEEQANAKIAALKQQNLWFQEAIDKAQLLPKPKFHWDYVMAEMKWLAEDFNREKTWKRLCAKKLANAVVKSLREKKNKISKEAKKETFKLKRNCANIAKMIKDWWKQMEKIVLAKQQFRLNAKRQEAVTTHLGKVIETTERYTEWLTEDLKSSSFNEDPESYKDPDFTVKLEELEPSDNEETIEIDEEEIEKEGTLNNDQELMELKAEAEMDLKELFEMLPDEYINELTYDTDQRSVHNQNDIDDKVMEISLECIGSEVVIESKSSVEDAESSEEEEDAQESSDEYSEDSSSENEDTFIEQEMFEDEMDVVEFDRELQSLTNEADIPMEELLKLYGRGRTSSQTLSERSLSEGSIIDDSDSSSLSDTVSGNTSSNRSSSEDLVTFFHLKEERNEDKNKFKFEGEFEALAEAALSTQPKGFTIESADIKVKVPHLIRHTLREYQCVGLDWLAAIYEKRLNGILADEMGLGKTIQTIALLSYMACEKAIWGPHLIIVPTSVILNWDIEFKKWCPGFKILTYYGSAKERREKRKGWTKTNAFHVCITSYKLAIQDSLSFKRKKWKYLILDEAQNIKNFKSQRWQTLLTFNSQRRLLLTGTPLQNNLMELWSLMHFLMPHIFQSHKEFQEWFGSPLTGMIEGNAEYNEQLVKRLHKVLRPFILRRLKKDVEKQMPKKYEHVIMCKLSKRQRCLYDDFMSLSSTKDTLESGQFLSVINILMQLRKVCNHPNLFETRPTISPLSILDELVFKAPRCVFIQDFHLDDRDRFSVFYSRTTPLSEMALDLPQFVSKRISELKAKHNLIEEVDSLEISDWVSNYKSDNKSQSNRVSKAFIARNLLSANFLDDSSSCQGQFDKPIVPISSSMIERENQGIRISKNSGAMEHCLQLPDYIIFSRKYQRNSALKSMSHRNECRCNIYSLYGPDLIDCVSLNKEPTLQYDCWNGSELSILQKKPLNYFFHISEDLIKRFVFVVPPAISNGIRINKNCLMHQRELRFSDAFLPQIKTLIPHGHFQILNQQRVQFPDTRLIQYDCGKLQTLEILLKRLQKENHRCLIFTQMTRMLDILEQFLSYLGYRYLRLDGATKVEQRQIMMEKFNQDPRIFIFILSTRSGGLGINLTGADTVIFYDSDWNPTMDAQAQDRCHRIGQTRDVHIYRLISQMTVEENILKKANQKRTLNDMAIEGGQFNTAFFKSNTLQDLFQAPSGLDDFVQEQNSTENEIAKEKPETIDTPILITRSGRQVKWRGGPPCIAASPLRPLPRPVVVTDNATVQDNTVDIAEFEAVLDQIEDETDRLATTKAKEEIKADLAEFDETIPWEDIDNGNDAGQLNDKNENKESEQTFHLDTERQIKEFQEQLNPIQRYGVRMIESVVEDALTDQLEMAHQNLQSSKKTWHLEQLKALHEADEMRAGIEEDDMLYCYGNYDPLTQKKELDRLIKEEAEYIKEEKRKTEEKAKQAKAEIARKTWSRQQHLLALKRKHFQTNNRYNKISRTIKQHRMLSSQEYSNNSMTIDRNFDKTQDESNSTSANETSLSSGSTKAINHLTFKHSNPTRQFFPKHKHNYSSRLYYDPPAGPSIRPIFRLPSKPNIINGQNHQFHSFGKTVIQTPIRNEAQISSFQNHRFQDYQINPHLNSMKRPRTLAMKTSNNSPQMCSNPVSSVINITHNNNSSSNNNTYNNNISKITQMKTCNEFINPSQSAIQIPMQSLCNFRTSLPAQQLILNSQPLLFLNSSMASNNHSFMTQASNSGSPSMIQIINQSPSINISQQQNCFSNPTLISDRSINHRFSNVLSLSNQQPFFVPSLSRNHPATANIIRINCSSNNVVTMSKPSNEYLNPNMFNVSNVSSTPILRLATVNNNISNSYQSTHSNPMIIINSNNPNRNLLSTLPSAMSGSNCSTIRPAPVRHIISSSVNQIITKHLPN